MYIVFRLSVCMGFVNENSKLNKDTFIKLSMQVYRNRVYVMTTSQNVPTSISKYLRF